MAGQVWAVDSLGGYFYSKNLSKRLREALQPMTKFRQFCDAKDASQQGKKKGDTYTYDIVYDVATAGGVLTETNTMPATQFTIGQGTVSITEAGNSVPYSGKLEDLGQFSTPDAVEKALRNDAKKVFDTLAEAQFKLTPLRVAATTSTDSVAVTLTTNGTVTKTTSAAFNTGFHKSIIDLMKERNIPPYTGDDYYALSWPSTYRTIKNSLESVHQYTTEGFKMIATGEIGRYENCRFVEQTNVAKAGTTYTDWIYFFGEDTVAEAVATPEEIRAKIPTDYGRSKGVAWYYLGGFGIVHTLASQARIMRWESAA
jgi:N4-gp56 family major capsid protein